MLTQTAMVDLVADNAGIGKYQAKAALNALFRAIADDIAIDHAGVRLPELGSLSRQATPAREGRNPRTGEPLPIKAGYRVKFTAGNALKRRLAELAPPQFRRAAE
jgi:DNA-binding protein HU-beta